MDNPFISQIDPFLSEPSEEGKGPPSILGPPKSESAEGNIIPRIELLISSLESGFRNALKETESELYRVFDHKISIQFGILEKQQMEQLSLYKDAQMKFDRFYCKMTEFIESKLGSFESLVKNKCDLSNNTANMSDLLAGKIVHTIESKIKVLENLIEKILNTHRHPQDIEQHPSDYLKILSENERFLIEIEKYSTENKSLSKTNRLLKEKIDSISREKDKFLKLFYNSNKKLKELEAKFKSSAIDKEALESKITKILEENQDFQSLVNSQNSEILALKQNPDSRFKGFLEASSGDIKEIKNKLRELQKKVLLKISSFPEVSFEKLNSFKDPNGSYLKHYIELIQSQITELETLESELENHDLDQLLLWLKQKNSSSKPAVSEILSSSDAESA